MRSSEEPTADEVAQKLMAFGTVIDAEGHPVPLSRLDLEAVRVAGPAPTLRRAAGPRHSIGGDRID